MKKSIIFSRGSWAVLLIVGFAFTGCATFYNEDGRSLHITSNPGSAIITFFDARGNKLLESVTPVVVTDNPRYSYVQISKDGYVSQKIAIKRKIHGAYWLNLLPALAGATVIGSSYLISPEPSPNTFMIGIAIGSGTLVGMIVDPATGSVIKRERINVILQISPEEMAKLEAQKQAEAERERLRGYIGLMSGVAGTVLLNGETTEFIVREDENITIPVDNANGDYTVAVQDSGGKIYSAKEKISLTGGTKTSVLIENPNPNSSDDFDISQNTSGGITITVYKGSRKNVIIPETIEGVRVTAIGNSAFMNKKLISVVIPNTVTSISTHAFLRCGLQTVQLGNRLTSIGMTAFAGNNLSSISFPASITSIGEGAFEGNQLASISFPGSITRIENSAFSNNRIASITLPNSITYLGGGSFSGNPLTTVVIPPSLAKGDVVAVEDKDGIMTLYAGVRGFGGAFRDVSNTIATITLPANVDEDNLDQFGENFVNFWKSQGKKAGTYTWTGRIWTVK